MAQQRLDKVLGETGRWSRKEARGLIRRGLVTVDGATVRQPEHKVDPETAAVTVEGQALHWQRLAYLMLNKPAGVLTATEDRAQKTVLDLLPECYRRQGIAPVGRLDKDTEGLLLLTNDGELAHRLTSPRYHVEKVYLAAVDGTVDGQDVAAFAAGLTLGDGTRCLPAELEPLEPGRCRVTLREGKYHQVKRMLAACGKPVTALERVSMGPLQLDRKLPRGGYRPLTPEEIADLRQAVGAEQSDQDSVQKVCGNY